MAAWLSGSIAFVGAAIVAGVLAAIAIADRGYWAYVTTGYLEIWKEAQGRMPDSNKIQDIHWCELLAAGFTSRRPPAAFTYEPWKIGGKPWRVLEYGDLRIPVFLHTKPWKGLFPQHFVRMTAYCRLLEMCEGFDSPFGVIVRSRSYAAVVVPRSAKSEDALAKALVQARETVRASEETNEYPRIPGEGKVCKDCPVGQPRRYHNEPFTRHGFPIAAMPVTSAGGNAHHSHCGDRFRWVPPHRKAEQIRLEF